MVMRLAENQVWVIKDRTRINYPGIVVGVYASEAEASVARDRYLSVLDIEHCTDLVEVDCYEIGVMFNTDTGEVIP